MLFTPTLPISIAPTPLPLEIRVLECPEALTLGPNEPYTITFQVLENGQPAQAGIVVNFLVDDTVPEVNPRGAMTEEQGRVVTNVSPTWRNQQQQTIAIGAMILPQRIGASCTTEVQLNP
jgi:hypothetical protein